MATYKFICYHLLKRRLKSSCFGLSRFGCVMIYCWSWGKGGGWIWFARLTGIGGGSLIPLFLRIIASSFSEPFLFASLMATGIGNGAINLSYILRSNLSSRLYCISRSLFILRKGSTVDNLMMELLCRLFSIGLGSGSSFSFISALSQLIPCKLWG